MFKKKRPKNKTLTTGVYPIGIYKLKADVPILEGIIAKTWGKEDELKNSNPNLPHLTAKSTQS